ncbi:NAD(P)H-binding protein [Undibacterium terreum]|uniref:Epimerase n=1 Tax=Undibacterium terreum TaxID=1224302 RepID=A0A916XC21_9BURK|nr:NAD(P)H-binding protein [Undibacterium terreum]GGC60712.1 epimerase [Undibacterium terreum]
MKVIIFGASGMVGQGVLRECLLDSKVESILSIVRTPTGMQHAKLRELVHRDFFDFSFIATELSGYDACFFCLGISSAGMKEQAYHRITYDITMAAAQVLAAHNPAMIFIYVSGASTDSSEKGSSMWARVKGKTENALLRLPFKAAYMMRPGAIQPLHGIRSKTKLYDTIYQLTAPLLPLLRKWFPNSITTTEQMGRVMILLAAGGGSVPAKSILEPADITALCKP